MASKHTVKANKLVRDSFTIPKAEFATIDLLKTRAIGLGTSVKKSELLRAGLMVLKGLSDASFKSAIAAVPTLKTGRPSAEQPAKAVAKAAAPATPAASPAPKAPAKTVQKTAAKPAAKAPRKPVGKTPVVKAKVVATPTPTPAAKPARPARKRPAAPAAKKTA